MVDLLDTRGVSVQFTMSGKRVLRAVDDISIELQPGKTLGIIGESGSGKSTLGRAIIGLAPVHTGEIHLDGTRIDTLSSRQRRRIASQIQMIFQDPMEALDPRLSVSASIAEPLIVRGGLSRREIQRRVDELLDLTGLSPRQGSRRPHELSGGQRQRVNIARALTLDPRILICDEAVSALDVSIQADILNLLVDIQEQRGLAYLFISHDIGVVARVCDRIGVMYLGQLVEYGDTADVIGKPLHPYTEALLSAEPQALPSRLRTTERIVLSGELPSPLHPPEGCRFRTRCRYATEICSTPPPAVQPGSPGHSAVCHFARELELVGAKHANSTQASPRQRG
ncbi:peptide/nickel transport system ATP-binding protein/oligopeptide transport system ATP-binding protein [Antricoccus suffuscus]|uniref:Peptide/nickel transport system ATP-binding protein/oligopeptide transport system ATP-binding protein n=1 Tax=Antricoccus suffuscus TaxID=1629062 RepID=A0A2T0ZX82_9ACTN|nr:ABC transporter ATP-binding protein [Antricoccus suffuscus]PRZ40884.1 peptide/nickel transport system ATP-binding protein/oligopeptide transport system ATP-binding protein [Antricoccus suffuscus]